MKNQWLVSGVFVGVFLFIAQWGWADTTVFQNPFTLREGQSVQSGTKALVMQSDGNLVLYENGKALWASNTGGQDCGDNQCLAAFQGDGNLVVYNGGKPTWASNTGGQSGAVFSIYDASPYLKIALVVNGVSTTIWAPCLGSGDQNTIMLTLAATGGLASLCPHSVFKLTAPIVFSANNQEISTQDYPTGASRARLLVTGPTQSVAIAQSRNFSGLRILNLVINGNAEAMTDDQSLGASPGLGFLNGTGAALVELGGNVNPAPRVAFVASGNPRGWSAFHITEGSTKEGCSGAKVTNSEFGPAGLTGSGQGPWADGLSVSCSHSIIDHNIIHNATDGGIVLFGGSIYTQVTNNIILADGASSNGAARMWFGGINLVDYMPYGGDLTGVLISGNSIQGYGSQLKIGIAAGYSSWWCGHEYMTQGATITDNLFDGFLGYGIVVNGAQNFSITGNRASAHFGGVVRSVCGQSSINGAPAALVMNSAASPGTTVTGNDFASVESGSIDSAIWGINQIPTGR